MDRNLAVLNDCDISVDTQEIIKDIYTQLEGMQIEICKQTDINLSHFAQFENNYIQSIEPAFKIKKGVKEFHLCFCDIAYSFGKSPGIAIQCWGTILLNEDFGHIQIRPETFLDKAKELIHHIELDISNDKAFSDKFFVLTNDPDKTLLQLNPTFRQLIKDIRSKEFSIEIIGNQLIIGNEKELNIADALAYVNLGLSIQNLIFR